MPWLLLGTFALVLPYEGPSPSPYSTLGGLQSLGVQRDLPGHPASAQQPRLPLCLTQVHTPAQGQSLSPLYSSACASGSGNQVAPVTPHRVHSVYQFGSWPAEALLTRGCAVPGKVFQWPLGTRATRAGNPCCVALGRELEQGEHCNLLQGGLATKVGAQAAGMLPSHTAMSHSHTCLSPLPHRTQEEAPAPQQPATEEVPESYCLPDQQDDTQEWTEWPRCQAAEETFFLMGLEPKQHPATSCLPQGCPLTWAKDALALPPRAQGEKCLLP